MLQILSGLVALPRGKNGTLLRQRGGWCSVTGPAPPGPAQGWVQGAVTAVSRGRHHEIDLGCSMLFVEGGKCSLKWSCYKNKVFSWAFCVIRFKLLPPPPTKRWQGLINSKLSSLITGRCLWVGKPLSCSGRRCFSQGAGTVPGRAQQGETGAWISSGNPRIFPGDTCCIEAVGLFLCSPFLEGTRDSMEDPLTYFFSFQETTDFYMFFSVICFPLAPLLTI